MGGQPLSKLGMVAVIAVAVAITVEGVTRAVGLAPELNLQYPGMVDDPFLPFKPRPGAEYVSRAASGEFAYPVRHNGFGFRDREHALRPDPGTFRILGLGDSFTYGVGAAYEETYLRRLEVLLNARRGDHPRIEIVKAGIPRYYPETERMLLEAYGLRFRPDLVLVGFTPNDVADTRLGLGAVVRDPSGFLKSSEADALGGPGHWLYLRSHAARIVLGSWVAHRMRTRHRVRWRDVYRAGGFHEPDWRRVEAEYDRMLELLAPTSTPLVVVVIPMQEPWGDAAGYPARRLREWAQGDDRAHVVDPLPAIRRARGRERLHWPRDRHCTPAGYRVLAEAIFAALESRDLVP